MNIRSLRHNAVGSFDCELEHPTFGWIPYTSAANDPDLEAQILYEAILRGQFGEPAPYAPQGLPPEVLQAQLTLTVQAFLDATPIAHGYDGILSLCTYATSSNPKFASEGQAGVLWRDEVWGKAHEVMLEVQSGTRPAPTRDELIALLPVMQWPT